MNPWINKYKSLYKWMIIPMVIMQIGIFKDYWGTSLIMHGLFIFIIGQVQFGIYT